MTAHWGRPGPGAATGNEAEIRLAFADTFRMLSNRISIFVSLPLRSLDPLRCRAGSMRSGKTRDLGNDPPRRRDGSAWPAPARRSFGDRHPGRTVVGSGIMAERLAGGNQAIALLGNTIPTGAILVVIITIFGPISGAHFNPAVTLVLAGRDLPRGAMSSLHHRPVPRRRRRNRPRAFDVRPRAVRRRPPQCAAVLRNGSPKRWQPSR